MSWLKSDLMRNAQFLCLAGIAFFTPWTYWPISSWFILPAYDLLFGLMLIFFAVRVLFPRPKPIRVRAKEVALILFLLLTWMNGQYLGSFAVAKPVLEMLLLLYVAANSGLSQIQARIVLGAVIGGGVIVSGIAAYQYLFVSRTGVAATLANPNLLSGYLSLLLPLSLGFWFSPRRLVKLGAILATTLLGLALTLTMTRTGWLVSLGAMAAFAVLKDRRLLIVLLIYVLLFGTIIDNAKNRLFQFKDVHEITTSIEQAPNAEQQVQTTVGSRLSLWRFALREFSQKPLTGIGLGNYREYLGRYLRENPSEGVRFFGVEETHNSYLKFLAETGLPGLLLFLLILGLWFGPHLRQIFTRRGSPLELALLLGMTAFLLHNMTNNLFLTVPTSHVFWLTLGVMWNLNPNSQPRSLSEGIERT